MCFVTRCRLARGESSVMASCWAAASASFGCASRFVLDTAAGAAANAEAGDKLVFRMTALSDGSDPGGMYVPNADGAQLGGRIPHLQLPPLP